MACCAVLCCAVPCRRGMVAVVFPALILPLLAARAIIVFNLTRLRRMRDNEVGVLRVLRVFVRWKRWAARRPAVHCEGSSLCTLHRPPRVQQVELPSGPPDVGVYIAGLQQAAECSLEACDALRSPPDPTIPPLRVPLQAFNRWIDEQMERSPHEAMLVFPEGGHQLGSLGACRAIIYVGQVALSSNSAVPASSSLWTAVQCSAKTRTKIKPPGLHAVPMQAAAGWSSAPSRCGAGC